MLLPYISQCCKVYELENEEISHLDYIKTFSRIKLISENHNFHCSDLILLPVTAFNFLLVDFPDIDDEEELEEWVFEYFSHHAPQAVNDYKINYLHLKPETDEHKILIVSLLRSEFNNFINCTSEIINPVYMGSGIESLGLVFSLNNDLLNMKQIIISEALERTLVFEYENCVLTGFHEFTASNLDPDDIARQDAETMIWKLDEDSNTEAVIQLDKERIYHQDFRKTGLILNHLYHYTKSLNLIDPDKIDKSRSNIEKRRVLYLSGIYAALFIILIALPLIASAVNLNRKGRLQDNIILISDKISLVKKQQNEIEHLKAQLQRETELTRKNSHFNGYLELIGRNIPAGIQLDKLTIMIKKGNYITIKGVVSEKGLITDLIANLEQEEYFRDVKLNYIETDKKAQSVNRINDYLFEIMVTVK